MGKRVNRILSVICYAAGIIGALYVGVWQMFLVPVRELSRAYQNGMLTIPFVALNLLLIIFSSTFSGLVWCIGYAGYNYFIGSEDPDWDAIESKLQEKPKELTE